MTWLVALGAADREAAAQCSRREYGWTIALGSEVFDQVRGLALDRRGSVFVGGSFQERMDFGPSQAKQKFRSKGAEEGYIASYTAGGMYSWVVPIRGKDDSFVFGVATKKNGDVVATGSFDGKANFAPGRDKDRHKANEDGNAFVTLLGGDGSYGWTKSFGGKDSEIGWDVAIDGSNDIVVVGRFEGTPDFDPGPKKDRHPTQGNRDAFITKLGANGSYRWTHTFGGTYVDEAVAVTTDGEDSIYAAGHFNETADFDPEGDHDVRRSHGERDAFLIRLTDKGRYAWTYAVGGTGIDYAYDVEIDPQGFVYVVGSFERSVDFDPDGGGDVRNANVSDAFVVKLTPDGSVVWVRVITGSGREGVSGIAFDGGGLLALTGVFTGRADLDPGEGVDPRESVGWRDGFVAVLTTDGDYVGADTYGGTRDDVPQARVEFDPDGAIVSAGWFDSTDVDFDPTAGVDRRSTNGREDFYITRLECVP
ncbi:MAG: hypothetical protein C4547_11210 [Phycisphaerales bacterium]|nr:MAG: hypothetical protein C4547_11210 [Phycisphaerales bacterium]